MKKYTVAVLGATGAVGQEMINLLEERNFPVGKQVPLASARSVGKTIKFNGEDVKIELACDEALVLRAIDICSLRSHSICCLRQRESTAPLLLLISRCPWARSSLPLS